ncbi:hypothetical protein G7Z17_g1634 [Cylindrodendrum hubeiense]|uniref:Cytochrome P450 monooxygenase n=1 Tax=Cylindrodendrum hubeiense TaxID=595255 RepID=A0A9P5HJA1_9HYPO|nr:hypothetical protein G7Z17_g1634 [Cylindrodendrum hubeiense]
MYSILVPVGVASILFVYFIISPVFIYFQDRKNFRKYPSINAIAGITDLGFMYEYYKGFTSKSLNRSKRLNELHKIHPVIRIGPNSLSFSGVQAIKDIYGHGTPCTKDAFYEVTAGTHSHLADVIDKAEHARKRKVLSSAYALKNLEDWEFKVAEKADQFLKACDAAATAPLKAGTNPDPSDLKFDYRKYSNFFSIDAIADIGISEKLGMLVRGDDTCSAERMDGTMHEVHFRDALHSLARAQVCLVWAYPWYKFNTFLSKLVSSDFRRMMHLDRCWNDMVYHRARKRMARYEAGESHDDFFQALMHDKSGQDHNLDWGEIVAEVSIMMNAGSDTTAMAMVNVMYYLLKHPDILKKLREEVDAVVDADEVVTPYDKVKHLPYLQAVLNESLRISPPVVFSLPRKTPAEGYQISSEFIPGNTSVSISAYVAHRDEEVFPDAETFNPDRWLGDKGRELQRGFIAFSAGARGCIGRNISYLEQTVLLASVVHRYEMALASPDWEPEVLEGTNLWMKEMPVKVWLRQM